MRVWVNTLENETAEEQTRENDMRVRLRLCMVSSIKSNRGSQFKYLTSEILFF